MFAILNIECGWTNEYIGNFLTRRQISHLVQKIFSYKNGTIGKVVKKENLVKNKKQEIKDLIDIGLDYQIKERDENGNNNNR